MNKMTIDTNTDDSGTLRIQIPGRPSPYRVHLTVEWEKLPPEERSDWPAGWLDTVPGSITDPTFVRHPQPPYETRKELE